jgi:predicted deacylase
LVLDLHNDWRSSIPYTVLDPPPGPAHREAYYRARRYARQTGFLLVEESSKSPEAQFSPKTLSGSLLLRDVSALTLELGEAYVVNEANVAQGVRAVWNVLGELDMVAPSETPPEPDLPRECRRRFLTYSDGALSSTSGVIRFLVKPGEIVSANQPVAKVYNAFGKLLETVAASQRAIVLGHSDSSVAFPGVPVVALGLL